MAYTDDNCQLPAHVESALKKASDELLANQADGHLFQVDHVDEPTGDLWKTAYDNAEIAEYINFDMLGEEDDKQSGFDHLLKNVKYEDILGNGDVIKIQLSEGIGQIVPEGYTVLVHYVAYISNLQEPFDVTYLQGRRPKRFVLGEGELLPGLEIGIRTMALGENARFIIKPQLAYREMGCPPRIPPNATVLFDVHLVSYLSPEKRISFDRECRDPKTFEKSYNKVKKLHAEGNEQFKLKNIDKAISIYITAIEILHITATNSEEEEIVMMKLMNKLYTNLSLCYLKHCAFHKVCHLGTEAMKYSERFTKLNPKLYFYWGKALRLLKDFSESKYKLQKALTLEPSNITIQDELRKLENDEKFTSNLEHFTFDDKQNKDEERLPIEFWEVFDTKLTDFISSDDDVLTVTLNKYSDDIQLMKQKASSYDLQCHIVTKNRTDLKFLAIQKKQN